MSDGEIVDAEIVDEGDLDDDVTADDPDIVEADVVDPHVLGESGVGDPAVMAMLRDTSGETPRPVEQREPAPAPAAAAPAEDLSALSFPRLSARTQRFTLGEPRNVVVSGDGTRIVFLRSRGPTDAVNCLWVVDATTGHEHLAADPRALLSDAENDDLPPVERAAPRANAAKPPAASPRSPSTPMPRSPRSRSSGRLFVSDLESGSASELPVAGPVFDPRPDPAGNRVAYVSGAALCVAIARRHAGGRSPAGTATRTRRRCRGAGPSSSPPRRCTASVATGGVRTAPPSPPPASTPPRSDASTSPIRPTLPARPSSMRTPRRARPTPTCRCTSSTSHPGASTDVEWDRERYPYLTEVHWSAPGLLIATQTRDQRHVEVSAVDVTTGATTQRWADTDDAWVELVPGVPCFGAGGALVTCADYDGARRLLVDGVPVTPPDLQVRAVAAAGSDGVVFLANPIDDATVLHVWRRTGDGTLEALTDEPGVHSVAVGGATVVIRTATLEEPTTSWDTLDGVSLTSYRRHADHPAARLGRVPRRTPPRHRRCCSPTVMTALPRCRYSSTRTADRTRCGPCGRTSLT